jgi:nucleoside-diphosphate-sugar epimerase
MKIFVIDAAGNLGTRLAASLVAPDGTVTRMHRGPDQAESVQRAGAMSLVADLVEISGDQLATQIEGHDAIMFSAGAHDTGRDQTTLIDGTGTQKAAEAAHHAGSSRFILVSTFPDSERGGALGEGYERYIRTKRCAEIHLTRTCLDWVIVWPGHMLDGAGTGSVSAEPVLREDDASRDDVAEFISEALHAPELSRTIVELTDGSTPIPEADLEVARAGGARR